MSIECSRLVARAAHVMTEHEFSQVPVISNERVVGSINEATLYSAIVRNPRSSAAQSRRSCSRRSFADISTDIDALATMLTPENPAVLVRDFKSDGHHHRGRT